MTHQEKEALLALGASLVFAIVVYPLRHLVPGFECETVFGVLLVFITMMLLGRHLVGLRAVDLDERDIVIRYRAGAIAASGFGFVVLCGSLVLCTLHRPSQAIPCLSLSLLVYYGWLAMYFAWSISIFVLHRRRI